MAEVVDCGRGRGGVADNVVIGDVGIITSAVLDFETCEDELETKTGVEASADWVIGSGKAYDKITELEVLGVSEGELITRETVTVSVTHKIDVDVDRLIVVDRTGARREMALMVPRVDLAQSCQWNSHMELNLGLNVDHRDLADCRTRMLLSCAAAGLISGVHAADSNASETANHTTVSSQPNSQPG